MPGNYKTQLNLHVRKQRTRLLAALCSGVGLIAVFLAVTSVPAGRAGNPKAWNGAFGVFADAGFMVEFAGWLSASGAAFMLLGLILALVARRM